MVRRSMQESRLKDDQFDPEMIHDIFTQAIQDLKVLQERQERKCARLEQSVQEEEKLYGAKLAEIMDQHTHCVGVFRALDERMSRCGGRALDVGEKLGAARAPRARAAAARDLLSHLSHFLSPGPVLIDLFNDPSKLNEAADVIQKLHTIAQELPPDKFEVAKKKIEAKYDEIERNLIEEFVKAQNQGNMAKMKEIANIMTNFKGYSQCVDAFIETSQMNALLGKDIFAAVLPLCKKNYTIISNVFPNPDQVMSKFVLNIFHLKLQKYIQTKLADKNDVEKYLKNLYEMYTSTQRVCDELVSAGLVSAEGNSTTGDLRRDALVNGAMAGANDGYAAMETRRLKAVMSNALNSYYTEKQHVKKQIQGGGFQELRRDLQAVIGTRANINIAQIENYGGETFLSEQLVQRMINDAKTSFTRCKTALNTVSYVLAIANRTIIQEKELCKEEFHIFGTFQLCTANELSGTTVSLLEVVIQHLLVEHVDYALDLGLQSIPIAESKSPPQIYFFDIVKQANKIVRMFEEHFQESVVTCMNQALNTVSYVLAIANRTIIQEKELCKEEFHIFGTFQLCTANELSGTTVSLLEVVIQHLLVEHVDYALDLGLQSIPIAESKSPPQIYFFDIVKQANKIVRMFEEHFQESVVTCMNSTSKQNECMQRKTAIMEQLENKLDAGLERAIAAIVSWVKLHLQTEQKKTDFKPEGDIDTLASSACLAVVSYLNNVMDKIHGGLEGDNLHAVTLELAVRLHRVIYEHLHNYQFNSAGAMIAICDVKEYRSAVCGRGARAAPAPAHALFDALHALCNLLLVKPENLHQVCEGETLAELDHSILHNFIQLRADYKSHKLSSFLKGLS
uniref:Exocyst complex component 5 n=1 Tax=Heliothis virescens TaxID=7102 RepID=A0A2A4K627_HELVI